MAELSAEDRRRVWRGLMRFWSGLWTGVALGKEDLRAAVDATDGWIEANQVSYNQALPVAARGSLSLAQKTLLFCVVAAMRVSPAFARRLVGGTDG